MSKKDYVHRDVSPGNILIVDGKGKLSDLEYAQIRGTGGRHGVRTVRQHVCHFLITYLAYMPGNNCVHSSGGPRWEVCLCCTLAGSSENTPARTTAIHNPIHDIESLWWVIFWVVSCKIPATTPVDGDERVVILKHRDKALRAFPQRLDEGARVSVIRMGPLEFYDEYAEHMPPSLVPYLAYLVQLKVLLVTSYSVAEASLSAGGKIDNNAWSTTHQDVIRVIYQVLADPECSDLTLYPLSIALKNAVKYKKARVQ